MNAFKCFYFNVVFLSILMLCYVFYTGGSTCRKLTLYFLHLTDCLM